MCSKSGRKLNEIGVTQTTSDVLREAGIHTEQSQSLKQTCYLARKKSNIVSKVQNILHKSSVDANSMAMSYRQVYE